MKPDDKKRKRRVLTKLRLTEISAVDRPCQEHARVAIMKRNTTEDRTMNDEDLDAIAELMARVDDAEARTAELQKQIREQNQRRCDDRTSDSVSHGFALSSAMRDRDSAGMPTRRP